jgi:hypothetical protein
MKTRQEIEKEIEPEVVGGASYYQGGMIERYILEVLLDIRDILLSTPSSSEEVIKGKE